MTSFVLQGPGASLYSPWEDPGVAAQPVERKLAAIFAADIACPPSSPYARLPLVNKAGLRQTLPNGARRSC
jgi:hypothetical protein